VTVGDRIEIDLHIIGKGVESRTGTVRKNHLDGYYDLELDQPAWFYLFGTWTPVTFLIEHADKLH
jgi:hypothetical protein